MSLTVAIPQTPLLKPLVERAEAVCTMRGMRLRVGSEQQCATWLATNAVELALLTPLGYAAESFKTDYRIIPATGLMLEGFTNTASLYLKPSAEELERCGAVHAEDFLMKIGAAVLGEKFDTPTTLQPVAASEVASEPFSNYEVLLDYGFNAAHSIVLDLSDEWTDYTQQPLPVAFWVCRPDGIPEDIADIVTAMARADLPEEEQVVEREHNGTTAERSGTIRWRWTADSESVLQTVIEMLFYWQFVGAISAVKLWKRDSTHPLQS
jgi:hypothetical protein